MLKRFVIFALIAFGIVSGGEPSHAANTRTSFSVTATVLAKCEISAVTRYSNYADAIDKAGGGLSIHCNNFAPYTVKLMPVNDRQPAIANSANTEKGNSQGGLPGASAGFMKSAKSTKSARVPGMDPVSSDELLLIVTY